jgi:hypothetical protein
MLIKLWLHHSHKRDKQTFLLFGGIEHISGGRMRLRLLIEEAKTDLVEDHCLQQLLRRLRQAV